MVTISAPKKTKKKPPGVSSRSSSTRATRRGSDIGFGLAKLGRKPPMQAIPRLPGLPGRGERHVPVACHFRIEFFHRLHDWPKRQTCGVGHVFFLLLALQSSITSKPRPVISLSRNGRSSSAYQILKYICHPISTHDTGDHQELFCLQISESLLSIASDCSLIIAISAIVSLTASALRVVED